MFCVRERQKIRAKGEGNSCENANRISGEKSRMALEFSLPNALEHGSCLLWLLCEIMSLETSARAISKCRCWNCMGGVIGLGRDTCQ